MATTASSNLNSKIFCPVRKCWVKATPEEKVRHAWLSWMIQEGDYPISLLAVEKAIASLPFISKEKIPKRRVDLVAYGAGLTPLLIVECKAVALSSITLDQVTAYNEIVLAPFLSIVNQSEAMTGIYDPETRRYLFSPGFFSYPTLVEKLSPKSSSSISSCSDKTTARSIKLASSRTLPGQE